MVAVSANVAAISEKRLRANGVARRGMSMSFSPLGLGVKIDLVSSDASVFHRVIVPVTHHDIVLPPRKQAA
jgi:hypothetical protein